MTREELSLRCAQVSRRLGGTSSGCGFVQGGTHGFIDTSAEGDGSRGIVFFNNMMALNFDGSIKTVSFSEITSAHVIKDIEDSFADELEIAGNHFSIRISDYSLDKYKLKELIDKLCAEGITKDPVKPAETSPAEKPKERSGIAEITKAAVYSGEAARSAPEKTEEFDFPDDIEEGIPVISETPLEAVSEAPGQKPEQDTIPEAKPEAAPAPVNDEHFRGTAVPEDYLAGRQSDAFDAGGRINWISAAVPANIKNGAERSAVVVKEPDAEQREDTREAEELEKLGAMSREQTMNFLSQALNEINAAPASDEPENIEDDAELSLQGSELNELLTLSEGANIYSPEKKPVSKLTVEPVWGDIYIKASRSLRELCESGRLSMELIETELKDRLLDSARAFAEITADEQRVPKVLLPKISELRNAADNFDEYFSYGEDVAVRAMFFMMYQMLSYADRIVETPETKERLNDFFRRFGSAGITLSMLDVRG